MFVWVFHRISGLLLIFLLGFQLYTGFFQASSSSQDMVKTMAGLHQHTLLINLTVFLLIFHAFYGIRTILLDLGVKQEKLVFWGCTLLATISFVVFLVLFQVYVAA